MTAESAYVVTLLDPIDGEALQQRIDNLLAADAHLRQRRGKEYDLRPQILDLKRGESENGALQLAMRLTLQPGKTGRPDEVLLALDLDPSAARIHRTQIVLSDED
jgi:hypothetical protein